MLSQHFVKTGVLPIEHAVTFSNLFDKRHSGDYDDFSYCDRETIDYLLPKAQAFIDALKSLI